MGYSRLLVIVFGALGCLMTGASAQLTVPFDVTPRQSAPGEPAMTQVFFKLDLSLLQDDVADLGAVPAARVSVLGERFRVHAGVAFLSAAAPLRDGVSLAGGGGFALTRIDQNTLIGVEVIGSVIYSRFDITMRSDYTQVDIPVALGFTLDFPLPNNVLVGLFGAPRLQYRGSDRADPTDMTQSGTFGVGAAAGIIATTGAGLGAQISADWLSLADEYPPGSNHEFVVSVGVHMRLRFLGSP